MTLTIKKLLSYSWMSQASYLDFSGLAQNDLRPPLKIPRIFHLQPISEADSILAMV